MTRPVLWQPAPGKQTEILRKAVKDFTDHHLAATEAHQVLDAMLYLVYPDMDPAAGDNFDLNTLTITGAEAETVDGD